jgi:acetyl esterase/lipase
MNRGNDVKKIAEKYRVVLAPLLLVMATTAALAQSTVVPPPMDVPKPEPVTSRAYAPQPILPGGIVMPLFPPGSPYLNSNRVREAEIYNMDPAVPGRITSIVNIHNPSIEVHFAGSANNTGAAIILVPGGGHNTLNVAGGGADLVPYFFTYGVNTIIIRSRLRRDGYEPKTDEVYDLQQAIRMVRASAAEWHIDPKKIGVMGFSAGAELAMAAAIAYDDFDHRNNAGGDPLAGVTSRPDFVSAIYPGPSLFTKGGTPPIPRNAPPSFIACAGWGDKVHAVWADEYFSAMLHAGVPNVEMHIYAIGVHGGGLNYRDGTAFGSWQDRFVDWFRDLGFFQKPGVETLAAKDVEAFAKLPTTAKP